MCGFFVCIFFIVNNQKEFELRKAKETISQLRTTLTIATESSSASSSKSTNSAPALALNNNNQPQQQQQQQQQKQHRPDQLGDGKTRALDSAMSTSDKSISSKSSSPSNNVTMLSAPCANKQAQRPVSADSNGNGNGNASDRLGASSWQQRAAVVDEADEDARRPDNDDASSSSSSPNGEEEEDVDEETDENRGEGVASTAAAASVAALRLMPHDKHALNFLVNEYLLENNYKMTSVAFSEENESQDLEDWDVVGVNRCKPPSIAELYKMHYMMRGVGQAHARVARRPTIVSAKQRTVADTTAKSKTKTEATTTTKRHDDKEVQTTSVSTIETASDAATTLTRCTIETATQTTTNEAAEVAVEKCDVGQLVNLDRDAQERQRSQIAALVDRQAILIGSIGKLESELAALNAHRHTHLKRIAQLE